MAIADTSRAPEARFELAQYYLSAHREDEATRLLNQLSSDQATFARAEIIAEPRSAYLMRGPARYEWEHSIPPVTEQRYSVTFRTLRRSFVQR